MKRVAVFADAGYIWVQLTHVVLNRQGKRDEIIVDEQRLNQSIKTLISQLLPDTELLRIYWYDGLVNGAPSPFNAKLNGQDGFKLRYGTVNSVGQQKGVDGLLIADLLNLSQNKSITDAVVISGDGDLAPGVEAAQTFGIKVYCLSIGPSDASSPVLQSVADVNCLWPDKQVRTFVSKFDQNQTVTDDTDNLDKSLRDVANEVYSELQDEQRVCLSNSQIIPKTIDAILLYKARVSLGRILKENERFILRKMLKDQGSVTESTQNEPLDMETIAKNWLSQLNCVEKSSIQSDRAIPSDLDKRLLSYARGELGGQYLTEEQKKALRNAVKINNLPQAN